MLGYCVWNHYALRQALFTNNHKHIETGFRLVSIYMEEDIVELCAKPQKRHKSN